MTSTHTGRQLVKARAALCALFACFGITLATWAAHLPSLQRATGMSTAMLGTVLLISGVGALAGMQVCGPLIDRLGSTPVAVTATAAMALSVVVPLAATTTPWAASGALLFGLGTGSADVSINAAAVAVEREYGRPILGSFHATFSVGTVIGSALAAVGFALHAPTLAASSAVVGMCVAIIAGVSGWMRHLEASAGAGSTESVTSPAAADGPGRSRTRHVLVLGTLAFLLLLAEGAAMDWSSLHAQQHLGASPTVGTITFGTFVTAMTIGRLAADWTAHRVGPVATLRWGCMLAAIGIAVVIAASNLPVTLFGWLLFGLGLAGGTPQVFTTAGNVGPGSGRVLARVVGMGYVALMAGPAVLGWVAELTSLNVALVLPLCAVAVCGLAAAAVKPEK